MVDRISFPTKHSGEITLYTGYSTGRRKIGTDAIHVYVQEITTTDSSTGYTKVYLRTGGEVLCSFTMSNWAARRLQIEFERAD